MSKKKNCVRHIASGLPPPIHPDIIVKVAREDRMTPKNSSRPSTKHRILASLSLDSCRWGIATMHKCNSGGNTKDRMATVQLPITEITWLGKTNAEHAHIITQSQTQIPDQIYTTKHWHNMKTVDYCRNNSLTVAKEGMQAAVRVHSAVRASRWTTTKFFGIGKWTRWPAFSRFSSSSFSSSIA